MSVHATAVTSVPVSFSFSCTTINLLFAASVIIVGLDGVFLSPLCLCICSVICLRVSYYEFLVSSSVWLVGVVATSRVSASLELLLL